MTVSAPRAVFLSYASQDAEAAKRICEALREAGVEVWFDQNELVGGDAWDSKIRRQIADCALFVPVISAHTQARREGYFRLEWKLAAQRTHMIADGTPFLLPVVIDDTRDAQALVPPEFKSVQWTRLTGGETAPAFSARVRRLLEGVEAEAVPARGEKSPGSAPAAPDRRPLARIGYGVAAIALASALVYATRSLWRESPARPDQPVSAEAPRTAVSASPLSPAREQARRALELVQALEATREDFALADEFAQRALKLDSTDGVVWAIAAQVHAAFVYRGWDTGPERREQNRTMAERAMRLAPNSPDAKMAQAGAWSALGVNRAGIEQLLREIVAERPDDKAALRFLAVTVMINGNFEECLALNERAAALPGGDPLALFNNARYLWQRDRSDEAFAALERSLAQKPFGSSLVLKAVMEIFRRGDLAAAEAALARIPQSALLEDRANYTSGLIPYYRRDAGATLKAWGSFPREFYSDFMFEGPKGMMIGLAYELGGRPAAAEAEWRAALRAVEKRLEATPNKAARLYEKSYLLACLGDKAAAEECLRTYLQLANERPTPGAPMTFELALLYVRLGRLDEVFASFPRRALTRIRLDPRFDALRADPRFDPYRESPSPVTANPPATDQNSVAVLAFANLSDDKANEYFSDGISEELLNVLAKVPGLRVTARTSAFHFKGKDTPIPEIARQLGVAYVVEGSVRKAGDKVRITAQLIKAADGFPVWSDTFTRDLQDIFAVQDEIAGLIAQNLRAKLATTRERPAPAPAVYALILQARHSAVAQTNEGARQAIQFYQQALAQDAKLADVWAEVALCYVQLGRFGGLPTPDAMREARLAARRALDLEPEHPFGWLAMGWVQRTNDRDWRGAIASFRRALEGAPENVTIMSDAAICFLNVGFIADAEALATRAAARDPLNPRAHWSQGAIFLWSGRPALAVESYRRAVALAPTGDEYHSHLARALALIGRYDEAMEQAQLEPNERYRLVALATIQLVSGNTQAGDKTLQEISTKYGDSMSGYLANLCAIAGKVDDTFKWLERGYESRDAAIAWVKTNASYRSVTSDPRWAQFLRKMGLADDQLK